jgi:leader peptidase (prepilin peptidase)/N-methyltransferase
MSVQIIIYLYFFVIGIVMGSFFTLATYRIPLKQDILHTRSYCPECNHKLNFFDLIPVLSYIFLRGKCRYCHNKISPRYIIMELLSGILYLFVVMSLKINFLSLSLFEIIRLIYISIMYAVLFIFLGILKETKNISCNVLFFGIGIQILYIIYLYILNINIYRYIIYTFLMCILILVQVIIKYRSKNEIKRK